MEPPKPAARADVLRNVPAANAQEYEEYERLLAKRYTKDPSQAGLESTTDPDAERLQELTKKLFGTP